MEYNTKELGSLNLAMTELSFDRDGVQSKHDVIHTHMGELKKLCIARSETFVERVERNSHREAERVPQLDEGDCSSWRRETSKGSSCYQKLFCEVRLQFFRQRRRKGIASNKNSVTARWFS